ncbi:MAG TPA: 4-hydroxy-tetrahydrodipicolinate synthase [Bacteroidales bacterium]|nr:4-hydroxy-tetrahydrodipicolinate synthase [Bacteroidales bacterium]HPS17877.1 4-hydroxy-tetrahydrodipicolinate synthase [Bacteroidales bacterium]
MKKVFQGTYTAVITPFTNDNRTDWPAFERIIEQQIAGGVEGIVFMGTTGESPTLSEAEHAEILTRSAKIVNKRCQVIHGIGSNNTNTAITLAKEAAHAGADGLLAVVPYYNKPTQEGLLRHFTAIANTTDVPIIIYNIKGRTGINMETSTLLKLAEHKNIVAVKEASGDVSQMIDVINKTPGDFSVLVGDDGLILPFMACGGDGVISVISNCAPRATSDLVRICLRGDYQTAQRLFYRLLDIMKVAFIESNPIPIKEIMSMLGYCSPNFRLPLCRASEGSMKKIAEIVEYIKSIEKPI